MKNAAIVLAAGRGNRLRPLTDKIPKCMITAPDGIPLLHRTVRVLQEAGISELILGVGFEKESVTPPLTVGMNVHRVENDEWDKTNNIYTLSLCAEYVKSRHLEFDNIFLIEGDIYLGDKVIAKLLMEKTSATAVLPASYTKRGSCVAIDDNGYVRVLRDNRDWNDAGIFKLANIYKLTRDDFLEVARQLPVRSRSSYYEAIIGELIGKVQLKAVMDGDCREVDNAYDKFSLADSLKLDYEGVRSNWGGLWRRPVQDHFFLSNPFYPTPFIRDRMKYSFDTLLANYPSGRRRLNSMLRAFCNVESSYPLYAVNGASEAIRILENYFNQRGTKFWLRFAPTFGEYSRFKLSGSEGATGVIIVSPNNPTAERIEVSELRELLGRSQHVILDLSLNTDKDRPYLELALEYPHLIVVKSLSKLFGIPGLRMGYVAVQEQAIKDFESRLPIWNINSVAEGFLELHLDSLSDYERSIDQWQQESLRIQEEIKKTLPAHGISASTSFVKLFSVTPIAQPLYEKFGILVADVTAKFHSGGFHTRIGIKSPEQNDYLLYALRSVLTGPAHGS